MLYICQPFEFKIKRVVYSTYQAVSGSGNKGIEDMKKGINGEECKFYKKDISLLARNGFDFETSKRIMDIDKEDYIKIIKLL